MQTQTSGSLSRPGPTVPASEINLETPSSRPYGDFNDLYLFANLSKQFRSLRIKPPLLEKMLRHLMVQLHADAAFLHTPQYPRFNKLVISPDISTGHANPDKLSAELQGLISASTRTAGKNAAIINIPPSEAKYAILSNRPYGFLAAGLRHQRTSYGWLGLVAFNQSEGLGQNAVNIAATLANQLAVMLANMEQYDSLEQFTIHMVCSLVCAIESKDAYAKGHSERVHRYAMTMSKLLELKPDEQEALRWAAILHDIGKIGIPEAILQKPSRLTKKEFALIKKHPQKGGAILKPIKQLTPSMAAIIHHHERYNGTGYPQGLKGEQIPLAARIIAVADTFDAITSPRSYRQAKSAIDAMLILDQVAGTQLDPRLIPVFKNAFRQLSAKEVSKISI